MGTLLTAWLVVHLLGGEPQRRYVSDRDAETGERTGRRAGGKVVQHVDDAYPPGSQGNPSGNTPFSSVKRPGDREPFDSPETLAQRAEYSAKVLDILEKIRSGEIDATRSRASITELQDMIRQLGFRLSQTARNELVSMIDTVDPNWRMLIGQTLGNLRGDVETASILMGKLEGRPDEIHTRKALLLALGNMDVPEVLPRLGRMLGTAFEEEYEVARAIGKIGGDKATEMLLGYLDKEPIRPDTAREIERILGAGANKKVLAQVEEGLSSESAAKRKSMLNVLAAARAEDSAESIRKLLKKETDPSVKSAAIRALGHIGDSESGKALLDLVQGGDTTQQTQAINAIHAIRNPSTVSELAKDWDRLPDKAQYAVIGAASRLSQPPDDLVNIAVGTIERSNNERVRCFAASVLGVTRDDKHVGQLGAFLRSAGTARERSVALQALRRIGSEKAAEEVLRHIGSLPERQQEHVRLEFERLRAKRAGIREASEAHR